MTPRYTMPQTRTRFAAFGLSLVMTLMVMSGIGTLAQTQAAHPADEMAAAAPAQQVVVIGQRGHRGG